MRLSALDHAFWCLESPDAPMHIGALAVFGSGLSGPVDAAATNALVARRAGQLPRLRCRVRPSRNPLRGPAWQEQPDFDAAAHIVHHELPANVPGDPYDERLCAIVGDLMAHPVPREAPPWEIHLISPAVTTATARSICQALHKETASLFAVFDWAEEEIEKAQHRHGETGRGPIWRAGFTLVRPTLDRTYTCEMLYRSHAAELLDRLARGEDTRPATTAKMIAALMETALKAPLTSSAFCLTMRLFLRAFPQTALSLFENTDALDPAAYESVHDARADEHEAELRRTLTQNTRTPTTAGPDPLPENGCGGGEQLY